MSEQKEPPREVGTREVGTKELRIRKLRIRIPHPALACPKVKKEHYRKWLLLTIIALPVVHMLTPEWEYLAAVVNGFVFYYEPVLETEV